MLRLFTILTIISCGIALKLPRYITACKKTDRNFSECALNSAKSALKSVTEGDKKYKVFRTNPFEVAALNTTLGPELELQLVDLHGYGLNEISIKSGEISHENRQINLTFFVPTLDIISKYKVDGKILLLPVQGDGDANVTFIDGQYKYKCAWDLKTVNGKKFINITDHTMEVSMEGARLHFDNLFNGDKLLGDNINKILNENWKEVVTEVGAGLGSTLGLIVTSVIQAYFNAVPYNEIFID